MADLNLPTSILDSVAKLKFKDNGDGTWSPQVVTSGAAGGGGPLSAVAATDILTFRTQVTGALTNSALVTIGGGTRMKLTRIIAKAGAGNTNTPAVRIGFGAAATPTGSGVVLADGAMAAGSGIGEGNGSGIIGVGADGDDLFITNTDPGGTIEVFGSYYTV